jgi:hypothetical protein
VHTYYQAGSGNKNKKQKRRKIMGFRHTQGSISSHGNTYASVTVAQKEAAAQVISTQEAIAATESAEILASLSVEVAPVTEEAVDNNTEILALPDGREVDADSTAVAVVPSNDTASVTGNTLADGAINAAVSLGGYLWNLVAGTRAAAEVADNTTETLQLPNGHEGDANALVSTANSGDSFITTTEL